MTPQEKALRDMWLAECWHLHPEWHATRDEKAAAAKRNAVLTPVDNGCGETNRGAA